MDDGERPLRNPFRSEQDAFRLLVIVGGAVAAIVLAATLGGPWVGVPVAAVLIAAGLRASARWLRRAIAERDVVTGPEAGDGPSTPSGGPETGEGTRS